MKKYSFLMLMGLSSTVFANGLLLNDANLRQDLTWLNQQGVIQLSTSTWPLSQAAVEQALAQATPQTDAQQRVIEAVQKHLQQQNAQRIGYEFSSKDVTYPVSFAELMPAKHHVWAEGNAGAEHWAIKLKLNYENNAYIPGTDVNVNGSFIAGQMWNQWLSFGQIPTWWGAGHDGALLRGDAARPVTGFTLQRNLQNAPQNRWLSWIGPWQYQLFAGQLRDYRAQPHAKLLGLRFTAQPFSALELGASRVMQWGGGNRSESLNTLWNAVIGNDNFDDGDLDKSNQIAGFDAKLNLQPLTDLPISVYGQYVGEDEAGKMPSKNMFLAGMDYSGAWGSKPYQLYAEWADTRTNAKVQGITYNHHIYTDGYYQQGFPLAHAMGGDGQIYSVGGHIIVDRSNRVSGRVLWANVNQSNRSTNQVFPQQDKIKALTVDYTHQLEPQLPIKIGAWVSDSEHHGRDYGLSLAIENQLQF